MKYRSFANVERAWLLGAASLLWAACAPAPHVGSHDCKVIAGVPPHDPFYVTCDHCQGRNCSHMDCGLFPCKDEHRIVQACNVDKDCKDLPDSRCGDTTEGHDICTLAPATKVAAAH